MATFYGGENFVDHRNLSNFFVPSNSQVFTIYTVPNGYYAIVRQATIDAEGFGTADYTIQIRKYIEVDFGGNQVDFDETIIDSGEGIGNQLTKFRSGGGEYVSLRLNQGDDILFRNLSGTNIQCKYNIIIDIYKLP